MANHPSRDILEAKRAKPYRPDLTIQELRNETAERGSKWPVLEGTEVSSVDAGGVPGEWVTVPGSAADKVFYLIHGGGFYRGSGTYARPLAARIAKACGGRAFAIDYRLAPEHPFPAQLDDTLTGYRWLLAQGVDPKRLVVGGISAGGTLTLSLLLKQKQTGEAMPAAVVPLSAWTDLTQSGASYQTNGDIDPFATLIYMERLAANYLNGADPRTPLASPLFGDLAGLPPMLLQVGTEETLLDDSRAFAEQAKAAGVDVTFEAWEQVFHGWHNFASVLPEAQQAIDRIGAFFKQHVD